MIEEIKNIKSTKKDWKSFGFVIGIIFSIIGAFLFYKEIEFSVYFWCAGLFFVTLGLSFPSILKPIYLIWMIFAVIIGWVMTRIILSVLFYLIISTIGIFARLVGKDFLNLKSENNESYWNIRNKEYELNQDYEKQF